MANYFSTDKTMIDVKKYDLSTLIILPMLLETSIFRPE